MEGWVFDPARTYQRGGHCGASGTQEWIDGDSLEAIFGSRQTAPYVEVWCGRPHTADGKKLYSNGYRVLALSFQVSPGSDRNKRLLTISWEDYTCTSRYHAVSYNTNLGIWTKVTEAQRVASSTKEKTVEIPAYERNTKWRVVCGTTSDRFTGANPLGSPDQIIGTGVPGGPVSPGLPPCRAVH